MRLLSLLLEVHVMNLKFLVREKTSGVNDSLNKTELDALLLQIYNDQLEVFTTTHVGVNLMKSRGVCTLRKSNFPFIIPVSICTKCPSPGGTIHSTEGRQVGDWLTITIHTDYIIL